MSPGARDDSGDLFEGDRERQVTDTREDFVEWVA